MFEVDKLPQTLQFTPTPDFGLIYDDLV